MQKEQSLWFCKKILGLLFVHSLFSCIILLIGSFMLAPIEKWWFVELCTCNWYFPFRKLCKYILNWSYRVSNFWHKQTQNYNNWYYLCTHLPTNKSVCACVVCILYVYMSAKERRRQERRKRMLRNERKNKTNRGGIEIIETFTFCLPQSLTQVESVCLCAVYRNIKRIYIFIFFLFVQTCYYTLFRLECCDVHFIGNLYISRRLFQIFYMFYRQST